MRIFYVQFQKRCEDQTTSGEIGGWCRSPKSYRRACRESRGYRVKNLGGAGTADPTASSTKESFAALLIAIRDRSAEKAREAALAMGSCGDPAAVDVLVEVVRNEDRYFHTTVRVAAVKSLGQFADARGIDAIVEATRDTMAEVSEAAIHALAATKDQQALAPLIRIVKNTDNFFLPTVRRAAILALKSLGGPQATAELKAVAANPAEDPSIRAAAQ